MPTSLANRRHTPFGVLACLGLELVLAGCGAQGQASLAHLQAADALLPGGHDALIRSIDLDPGAKDATVARLMAVATATGAATPAARLLTSAVAGGTASPAAKVAGAVAVPAATTAAAVTAAVANAGASAAAAAGLTPVAGQPNLSLSNNLTCALPGAPAVGVGTAFGPAKPQSAGGPLLGMAALAESLDQPGVLFSDDFTKGLSSWRIASPSAQATRDPAGAWAIVGADDTGTGTRALGLADRGPAPAAQRTFYLALNEPIDLAGAEQPRLRLGIRNAGSAPASFKAVWQSADTQYPEETLIATRFDADADWETKEFDLGNVSNRPGRLVLIARAAQGAVPMVNDVTVYDSARHLAATAN